MSIVFQRKFVSCVVLLVFLAQSVMPVSYAQMQALPAPGGMIQTSPAYTPAMMVGMTIDPKNPLQFEFLIDTGDDHLTGDDLSAESQKLINYFLTTLTVPEDELWVNLSPDEPDRIIANGLGTTEMGHALLAQDYLLKQLMSSLMYPEKDIGKEFWERVYKKAGTRQMPTDIFNKIWIVPEHAHVFVNGTNVFVVESYLKVMLEEDYWEGIEGYRDKGTKEKEDLYPSVPRSLNPLNHNQIIRDIILPEIEHEINHGKNFAQLRQVFHSMILATWYKKNLRTSFLHQAYANQNKVDGVNTINKEQINDVYEKYLAMFQQGVFNYIKEDMDPATQETIPRKYFAGGVQGVDAVMIQEALPANDFLQDRAMVKVHTGLSPEYPDRQSRDDALFLIDQIPEVIRQQIIAADVDIQNHPVYQWIEEAQGSNLDEGQHLAVKYGLPAHLVQPGLKFTYHVPDKDYSWQQWEDWFVEGRRANGKKTQALIQNLDLDASSFNVSEREVFVGPYHETHFNGFHRLAHLTFHEMLHDIYLFGLTYEQQQALSDILFFEYGVRSSPHYFINMSEYFVQAVQDELKGVRGSYNPIGFQDYLTSIGVSIDKIRAATKSFIFSDYLSMPTDVAMSSGYNQLGFAEQYSPEEEGVIDEKINEVIELWEQRLIVQGQEVNEEEKWAIHEFAHTAKQVHQDHRRKSGEPYFFHPLEVARRLIQNFGVVDPIMIRIALMHDAKEDREDAYYEELLGKLLPQEKFGVAVLTKLSNRQYEEDVDPKRNKLLRLRNPRRHYPRKANESWFTDEFIRQLQIINLADRLANMNDLTNIFTRSDQTPQNQTLPQRLFQRTVKGFIPLFVQASEYLTDRDRQIFYEQARDILEGYTIFMSYPDERRKEFEILAQAAYDVLPIFEQLLLSDAAMVGNIFRRIQNRTKRANVEHLKNVTSSGEFFKFMGVGTDVLMEIQSIDGDPWPDLTKIVGLPNKRRWYAKVLPVMRRLAKLRISEDVNQEAVEYAQRIVVIAEKWILASKEVEKVPVWLRAEFRENKVYLRSSFVFQNIQRARQQNIDEGQYVAKRIGFPEELVRPGLTLTYGVEEGEYFEGSWEQWWRSGRVQNMEMRQDIFDQQQDFSAENFLEREIFIGPVPESLSEQYLLNQGGALALIEILRDIYYFSLTEEQRNHLQLAQDAEPIESIDDFIKGGESRFVSGVIHYIKNNQFVAQDIEHLMNDLGIDYANFQMPYIRNNILEPHQDQAMTVEALSPLQMRSLTRQGLQPRIDRQTQWFVTGHPKPGLKAYHDVEHSFDVGALTFLFAKARGLPINDGLSANFLYHVGLLHAFDPRKKKGQWNRDITSSAQVPNTIALLEKDFTREESLERSFRGNSQLIDVLGWDGLKYFMAKAIIWRSEYPFGIDHSNPYYLENGGTNPVVKYYEALKELQAIAPRLVPHVMREAAIFSEYVDKMNVLFRGDFDFVLDQVRRLHREIYPQALPDEEDRFLVDNYHTFIARLGQERSFAVDYQVAKQLGIENLRIPSLEEMMSLVPPELVRQFYANKAAYKKLGEAYQSNGANFSEAVSAAKGEYTRVFQDPPVDLAMLDTLHRLGKNILLDMFVGTRQDNIRRALDRYRPQAVFKIEDGDNGIYFVPEEVRKIDDFDGLFEQGDKILHFHLNGVDRKTMRRLLDEIFTQDMLQQMMDEGYVGIYMDPTNRALEHIWRKQSGTQRISIPIISKTKTKKALTSTYAWIMYGYPFGLNAHRIVFPFSEIASLPQNVKKQDAAMMAPGGIDLNPDQLDLQESGSTLTFEMEPFSFDMAPENIQGFRPVILNITPVTNLPLLLGRTGEDTRYKISLKVNY